MPDAGPSPSCRRCGRCCRLGGPALHRADLPRIGRGVLPPSRLVTLRRGHHVTDNVAGGVGPAPAELVKLAPGPDGRACVLFIAPDTCAVHADRPLECRLLFCQAPQALARAYDRDRLTRADILGPDSPLAGLCAAHEAEIDLVRLDVLCRAALAGDAPAAAEALRLVRLDAAWRQLVPERARVAADLLPFLLGAPPRLALPACRALLGRAGLYKAAP